MIKNIPIFLIVILFQTFISGFVYSMAGKVENIPLKPVQNPLIQNGEFLKYGRYKNGEKFADLYFVTILTNTKKYGRCAWIYNETIFTDRDRELPINYTNYNGFAIISLDTGSLLELKYYWPDITNEKDGGEYYRYYRINKNNNRIELESKSWNGYEFKGKSTKIMMKPDFPVLDVFYGPIFTPCFLDVDKPGILYWSVPEILKELMPGFLKAIKEENIKTKAGDFITIKYSMIVADPFIGQLIDSYSRQAYLSVEKSGRRLTVWVHSAVGEDIGLEEISNVIKY